MGAQWKQKWREINAHKKGQLVNKLVKEIHVAAKLGGPDPDLNARLAAGMEAARQNSVPKDTIERAGQFGSEGSVTWMFNHLGVIEASHENGAQDLEEVAIEAGADEVEALAADDLPEGGIGGRFLCAIPALNDVNQGLKNLGWKLTTSELTYEVQNPVSVPEEDFESVSTFLRKLDDNDDTHRIYSGLE